MSSSLACHNLIAYSLQIGLLVAVGSLAPALLGLRLPHARLAYWQMLLAACLLLPLVRPWQPQVQAGDVLVTTTILAVGQPAAPAFHWPSASVLALWLIATGALARLAWLGLGFWKLHRYRRDSQPLDAAFPWPSPAEVRVATGITSPVTFGARRPVVLVPPQFPALDPEARHAILCHELLHVRRRDWPFTVAEELIRAVLWFHPGIWWVLGELQLAREQAVDREVIGLTRARDQYVDALLAIAGARPQPDLVPASLFLRRRHLKQRVIWILKEVHMSKTRLVSALAAGLCVLLAAAWMAVSVFPLAAAPQVVNDAAGVTVDTGGAALLHRTGVRYPEEARAKGVQGGVTVEVRLDAQGNVADAHVVSGPDELRNATLQSVLGWHFAHDAAGSTRQVTVSFQLPATAASVPASSTAVAVESDGATRTVTFNSPNAATFAGSVRPAGKSTNPQPLEGRTVKVIRIFGLSDAARDELLAKLPVREGDTLTAESSSQVAQAVKGFDEHLSLSIVTGSANEAAIAIAAPGAQSLPAAAAAGSPPPPGVIKVGGNVQSSKLIQQARPVYPPEAKLARIQGVVRLQAIIAKDGTVEHLEVLSGHPLLVPSALEAVRNWVYQTTLLNGQPVEVQTQIDVNYTLSQ